MRTLQAFFLSFLLVTLAAPQIKAEEQLRFTISVVCVGAVECNRGIQSLSTSLQYIESKVDVKFEIKKIHTINTPIKGTTLARWEKMQSLVKELHTGADLNVVFDEVYTRDADSFDFEEEGVLGRVSEIGDLGLNETFTFIKVLGSQKFLSRIITHEIGHNLGAHHIAAGLMHPSAGANQYCDEYAIDTIREIEVHIAKVKLFKALVAMHEQKS